MALSPPSIAPRRRGKRRLALRRSARPARWGAPRVLRACGAPPAPDPRPLPPTHAGPARRSRLTQSDPSPAQVRPRSRTSPPSCWTMSARRERRRRLRQQRPGRCLCLASGRWRARPRKARLRSPGQLRSPGKVARARLAGCLGSSLASSACLQRAPLRPQARSRHDVNRR